MEEALLVLHIIAVAAWLGGNLVLGFTNSYSKGADAAARRWWAETQGRMGKTYYNAAGVIVLLTGVGLVLTSDDVYQFSDAFVSIGFLAVIVGAMLGILVFGPRSRDLVAAIDAGDEAKEAALNNRLAVFGMIDSLVLVVAIVSMVAKWGLG